MYIKLCDMNHRLVIILKTKMINPKFNYYIIGMPLYKSGLNSDTR